MAYVFLLVALGLIALAAFMLLGGPRLPPETEEIIERVSRSDLSHVVSGETGYTEGSGVRIWYEDLPAVTDGEGVVLLSLGMGGDSLFWPTGFIRSLRDAGYRVIRYDHRGTGGSDWMEAWRRDEPYTVEDMADDALAVLDARSVDQAHMIGLSLGGFVAQEVALRAPQRVASLTLMSTAADPTDSSLPGPNVAAIVKSALPALPLLRYRLLGGEANLVKERIAKFLIGMGPEAVDIEELAETVLYDLRERRGLNLKALRQHQAAVAVTRSRYPLLSELATPALVIHGTEDIFFPIEHARRLAELLPNARLLVLDGAPHQFPYPDMPAVTGEILSHLRLLR